MFSNIPVPRGATRVDHREKRPYVHQPYPSTRFHPDGGDIVVQNEDEDRALGKEWKRSPFPPPPPPPPPAPEPTAAELRLQLAAVIQERDEIQAGHKELAEYCAEKVNEILELREELDRLKNVTTAPPEGEAAPESETPAAVPETEEAAENADPAPPTIGQDAPPSPVLSKSERKRQAALRK